MWQILYPPKNGVSLGSYLIKNGNFCQKGQTKTALAPKHANFFEIVKIGQKVGFLALCPGQTGPLPRKKIVGT